MNRPGALLLSPLVACAGVTGAAAASALGGSQQSFCNTCLAEKIWALKHKGQTLPPLEASWHFFDPSAPAWEGLHHCMCDAGLPMQEKRRIGTVAAPS